MAKRLVALAALLLLAAWSIVRTTRPPHPVPATSPDTVFSAERAMRHVEQLAVRPHAMGSEDHARVRDYLIAQLASMGLRPQLQATTAVGTRYQAAGRVENVLAWMPGSDTTGKAVLVVTHYDGVGAGPAAGDDAAATAALLETVRALRARKTPLAHDVFFLITDGEEAGLLGAAAFVREHKWAKDAAVILNFEARGTSGRSYMFETGPGDRAVVSALRHVGDVTAGSVFTTVYRTLSNDTDLSELSILGLPALNFAFTNGVERYHTSHDDIAHLDAGSVQHHGVQMLALVKRLADGQLPLPKTGDAVFFDLPIIGLVVYPFGFALPLAIVALVLTGIVTVRAGFKTTIGVVVVLLAVAGGVYPIGLHGSEALVHLQEKMPWGGAAEWRALTGAAIALFSIAFSLCCYGLAKKWASDRALQVGALVVWTILAVALSVRAPGASYLFVWPSIAFATAALITERRRQIALWIAAAITLSLFGGLVYAVSVIMLGVVGGGAMALGALSALVVLLLMPLVADIVGNARFAGAGWVAIAGVAAMVIGLFTTRSSSAHPISSALVYAQNADSSDAWFGSFPRFRDDWTTQTVGDTTPSPAWTKRLAGNGFVGRKVERVAIPMPNATYIRDTIIDGARRVVFRVFGPPGNQSVRLRVLNARVSRTAIDARVVDTTRYRQHRQDWLMEFWAVPDSGAVFALSVPPGTPLDLELVSRVSGLPVIPGVGIPPRPSNIVPVQYGDATYGYKRLRF
jgi:hypothetical protein